jgi:prepilin-type N-terminal cleavage/methylation domain-containing protein
MKQLKNQHGFTLVEIAIVLVIIGLLLGGVLKGQELIENSKVKKAASDLNGITAAYNAYIDRYRMLPGDDGPTATLTARGTSWTAVTGGDFNGIIASTVGQTFTGAGENDNFWQHLKASGFINGNPALTAQAALIRNPFGGLMGFTNANTMTTAPATWNGNKVCLSQVPGKLAVTLDNQLDDGVPNTGSLRATVGVAGANTPPGVAVATYIEDDQYTICRSL